MIPMRDGVRLYTVIVMKKGTHAGPMLLTRTPYNAAKTTSRNASQKITEILPISDAEFVEDGYIRVYQDVRGAQSLRGRLCDEPAVARPDQPHGGRQFHRRLGHDRLAGEERAREQRARGDHRLLLSGLYLADGADRSAPGAARPPCR